MYLAGLLMQDTHAAHGVNAVDAVIAFDADNDEKMTARTVTCSQCMTPRVCAQSNYVDLL